MRKFFALTLVALVSLTMVLAAVGCTKKAEESAPATEQPAMQDTSSMMAESTMTDTSMHQ